MYSSVNGSVRLRINYFQIDRWMSEGSGWVVGKIMKIYVDIAKFDPMQGRSYFPLPGYLAAKGAIVNVKNNDSQCLK